MNLRTVLQGILSGYGETVSLYRVCKCSEVGQYALPDCSRCTGSGYESPAEKHKTYKMVASIPLDETASYVDEGAIQHDNMWFWFAHHVNPSPSDIVVTIDPGAPTGKVAYMVGNAIPIRGARGQIAYWRVATTRYLPK